MRAEYHGDIRWQHLRRFTLAVDIVSDNVFEKVFNIVVKQLGATLGVVFSEFLVPMTGRRATWVGILLYACR